MARFKMWGHIAEEQDENTATGVSEQEQKTTAGTLIYETDNEKEARSLIQEGGFIKNDKWHVITAATDETTGMAVPNTATGTAGVQPAENFPERP